MTDLPLDETALQAAHETFRSMLARDEGSYWDDLVDAAISTYLREAGICSPKKTRANQLCIGTKVQSKNWAKPYGHVVGYDEDLHMPIVKWDGTEDHGPEACETDEFEVIK